ncbi:MAG: protein kinase [Deltaproteobacteria bacterium]|nr:protein kinase [Deltaproteobacteria bacterium]MCB9787779.1 protein kinase [Deltaproteobacteria bacterium]
MTDTQPDPLVGTTVAGRFEIIRTLGQGGMGTVYEARQLAMDRRVALKLIHPHVVQSQAGVERFAREMQATARIRHPNTIQVYDYGQTEEGRLYLAMEFLEGRSLAEVIRDEGPLGFERVVHIGTQVARALHAAHSEGIVHRDLKPDNIMLIDRYGERDQLQVLDFGIAHFLDQSHTQLTTDGAIIGTPAYMAPEQAKGVGVDARTDLYALGVVLYEMVTGSAPFRGPTTVSVLVMHVQVPPRPPSELVEVPDALESLILALLAKAPDQRPATAAEVVERLRACAPEAAGTTGPKRPAVEVQASMARQEPPGGDGDAVSSGHGVWVVMGLIVGAVLLVAALVGGAAWWAMGGAQGSGAAADAVAAATEVGGADDAVAVAVAADVAVEAEAPDGAQAPAERVPDVATHVATSDASPEPLAPLATAQAREALDALYRESGDPPPPAACRAGEAAEVARLTAAATLLLGGAVGGARAEDQRAVTLLEDAADGEADADGEVARAERGALLARARLLAGAETGSALQAARDAAAACPDWAWPQNLIGNALQLQRDLTGARAAYERALVMWPSYAAPRFNVGLLAMRSGDQEAAVAAFTGLLERDPSHPNAHLARAQANLARHQAEAALPDLAIVLERDPDQGGAWLLRGQALQLTGKADDARRAFCRAKELGEASAAPLCP